MATVCQRSPDKARVRPSKIITVPILAPVKDISTLIHGDDFVSPGTGNALAWLEKIIKAAFEITSTVIGPEDGDKKQVKVFNRTVTYTISDIEYEPDPRHAELIVGDLGLENCNSVATPSENEEIKEGESEELCEEESSRYKSTDTRANYLSALRPEIQYATKECARAMSKPTVGDASKLKRLGRFLKGHLRTIHVFPFQRYTNESIVHTDANWASDKRTRQSTSGGSIRIGQHLIKT